MSLDFLPSKKTLLIKREAENLKGPIFFVNPVIEKNKDLGFLPFVHKF